MNYLKISMGCRKILQREALNKCGTLVAGVNHGAGCCSQSLVFLLRTPESINQSSSLHYIWSTSLPQLSSSPSLSLFLFPKSINSPPPQLYFNWCRVYLGEVKKGYFLGCGTCFLSAIYFGKLICNSIQKGSSELSVVGCFYSSMTVR